MISSNLASIVTSKNVRIKECKEKVLILVTLIVALDHDFEAIRTAFNERSYQEVVDLAATRTNARLVGWAREIVKVSRQYLKIEEVKEYRLKQLRNQPRKVNDEAVMENYTPIVEEIFIA